MRTKLPILSIALLAALPAAAHAATPHHYAASMRIGTLSTAAGYPAPGGTAVLAGTWNANSVGAGSLVEHVKIAGHPTDRIFTLTGDEVAFLPLGTVKDSFTGWGLLQPDGSLALRITGHATGGTGIYSGAKGNYVFNGSTPAGSTITTGRSSGTIVY